MDVFQFGPERIARAEAEADVEGNAVLLRSLSYNKSIDGFGDIGGTLSYTHRGDFKHRMFNNPLTDDVDSYDTLDLVIRILPSDSNWQD